MRLEATIFADGEPCSQSLRKRLSKARFTIALDGAAEKARKEGWVPNLIAGDFDAVTKGTLRFFEKKGSMILHTPDQNYTDLEKAIAWCTLRDADSIWIAQATGGRLDHTFANLSFLKRFHSAERELVLWQERERVFFLRGGKCRLAGKIGRRIAVLPFPECTASSRGLEYELRNTKLELGIRESVANRATRKVVELALKGEALVSEGHG